MLWPYAKVNPMQSIQDLRLLEVGLWRVRSSDWTPYPISRLWRDCKMSLKCAPSNLT